MTRKGDESTVPARLTAEALAEAMGHELSEVQQELGVRGEPNAPGDFVAGDIAVEVAAALGVSLSIEPRDLALEHLYSYETLGEAPTGVGGKAGRIVKGVLETLDDIDAAIEAVSEHWSVARMPLVDRNVLRIGVFELESDRGTPTAVVVSEAVRMAQTYSTERSAAFVNGVLATLAKSIRDE